MPNKLINLLKIIILRAKKISVPASASINWNCEISKMGGNIIIGENSSIDFGAILRAYGGEIFIGSNCSINPYCILYGHGGLKIGNGVRIAAHTIIIPANHIYTDPSIEIRLQGETKKGITILDDVWIGAGARILDGVTIGKGAIIAAGSVVNRYCEPYGVYAGVPAKLVKRRDN